MAAAWRRASLNVVSTGNAANGVNFRESGAGNLSATVTDSSSTVNTLVGVRAEQTGAGSGTLTRINTDLDPNGAGPTQLIGTVHRSVAHALREERLARPSSCC